MRRATAWGVVVGVLAVLTAMPTSTRAAEGFWTTARVFGLARRREVRRFDIRLRRAGVLRGTVRDLRGRLLPGAEVSASVRRPADDDADSLHRDLGTRLWTVGNLSETTGPDGRFVLAPLPFHRWIDVHARGSGLSNLSLALYPDRPEGRMDFVVDPGGALRVLLLAPSGPRKGPVAVELRRPDGDLVFSSGWHPGDSDGPIPTTHEQLHEVIAPGEYRLAVKAEGLRGPARPLTVRIRRGRTSTVRVSLRAQGRPGPS